MRVAILATAAACAGDSNRIDPFPVSVDVSVGPTMVTVSAGVGGEQVPAVIDTLSPVTILDGFIPDQPPQAPRRRQTDLVLYAGSGDSAIARVAFDGVSTFDLHPCPDVNDFCSIGFGDSTVPIRAIVGADVLARTAVRFDVPASELSFFPDIAGDNATRGEACEAVFTSPFAGGGTITLGGSEVPFTGNRVAVGACLNYDIGDDAPAGTAADTLFLVSTGIAVSLIAESAYERYATLVNDAAVAPTVDQLPASAVHLPSGSIPGRLGSINRIALVGEGATDRGPCQELYANKVLSRDRCNLAAGDPDLVSPCPCTENAKFCSTAAAIELERSFPVLVVDDLQALVQALRDELRPDYPEVDGILSLGALAPLSFDIDYPNGRVLGRCAQTDECQTRPAVRSRNDLNDVVACLPAASDDGN